MAKSLQNTIFFTTIALITLGVIMSYSLGAYAVGLYNYGEYHFFMRELFIGCLGVFMIWGLAQTDPNKSFHRIGWAVFIISIILMIAMHFLPQSLVSASGGAKRWIKFPFFSLAPAEFFKIGFVYFMAWSLSRKFAKDAPSKLLEEIKFFIPYLVLFVISTLLIAVGQNDLGQVVVLAATLCVMLVCAGGSFKFFGLLFSFSAVLAVVAVLTSEHRMTRVKMWWANAQDSVLSLMPSDLAAYLRVENLPEPYQLHHALNAMSNGGFFGTGLGLGTIKLGFLSDVHTDIILAGITEELGFCGLFFTAALFLFLIFHILKTASRVQKNTHYLFCVGVALLIGCSFIINAFGIAGITPIKGIAVPFLSYGGSSLLANCLAVGLVLSLASCANEKEVSESKD